MRKYILTTTTYHTEKELDFYDIVLVKQKSDSCELKETFKNLHKTKLLLKS